MDDDGRLDLRSWDMQFAPSIKEHHYHHHHHNHNQGLKFMPVIGDRDAALFQRNLAISEKKNTYAEKEAAFLQREMSYAERNRAMLEREAVSALSFSRDASAGWNGQRCMSSGTLAGAKILQALAENPQLPPMEYPNIRPVNTAYPASYLQAPQAEEPHKFTGFAYRKREVDKEMHYMKNFESSEPKVSKPKKQKKQIANSDGFGRELVALKKEHKCLDVMINGESVNISSMPIPVCSCTGVPQQCYRWGNGGWQSACCTTNISMYPLPMNPKRRGARVAGRKMSGGAFKKLLERLGAEGYNLNCPIDLKSYWAKHGTNKFVTIR